MNGAVLAIGDELICGYQLDTNSQEVSQQLALVPVDVVLHVSVGDDPAHIQAALRMALGMVDVLVVTGGLGPTEDDLTRQVIAAHFGRELIEDPEALERIRERFARRGRTMPDGNRMQAWVPAGSQIIQNNRGTAAGFYLTVEGKHIFVTPGVPYELTGMMEDFILPKLRELVGNGRAVARRLLNVYGMPESEINERIRDMMARGRNPLLGSLPHLGTITLEVVASAPTREEAEALAAADVETLRARLGAHIISENGQELPEIVAELLSERALTIATAEWGTGGLVAGRLTRVAGAGRWYRHGAVDVPALERPVETEEEAVRALAALARASTGADIGVGVGHLLVEDAQPGRRPWGSFWAAVDVQGQAVAQRFSLSGERSFLREWAADAVLGALRACLLEPR